MRYLKLILLTMFLLLSACQKNDSGSNNDDLAPQEVRDLTAKFKLTMMDCPEKIWAQYNWNGLKIAFIYPNEVNSWIWDASSNSVKKTNTNSLQTSVLDSWYEFLYLDGQPGMSLNMKKNIRNLFELGVHEYFHFIGQKNWTSYQLQGPRGTLYPVESLPRLYRRLIFDNLKKYLVYSQDVDLAKARFWYDKWSTEYPMEVSSTTDSYEGTAYYTEKMAAAVSELGCSATDTQLKEYVSNQVQKKYGYSVSGKEFQLDAEGYEIGSLAAFLLRFQNRNLQEWNVKIAKGNTPVQVLLSDIKPIAEELPSSLQIEFKKSEEMINQKYSAILDADLTNWTNKNYVRLSVPYDWLQSNLSPKFFATSSNIQMNFYPLALDHHYLSPDGTSSFTLKTNTVVFDNFTSPCYGRNAFTLVATESMSINSTGISDIQTDKVTGKVRGQVRSDTQGYPYFCVN